MEFWWDTVNTVSNIRKWLEKTTVNLELSSIKLVTNFVIAILSYKDNKQSYRLKRKELALPFHGYISSTDNTKHVAPVEDKTKHFADGKNTTFLQ